MGLIDRFFDSAMMVQGLHMAVERGAHELAKERRVVSLCSQGADNIRSFHITIFPQFTLGKGSGIARSWSNLSVSPVFKDVL